MTSAHPPGPPPIPRCPECERIVSHHGHAPDCARGQASRVHWSNVRVVEDALRKAVEAKRQDREFMARLARNIEKHADLLDRLAAEGDKP